MSNAFQPVLSIRARVEERQAPSFIRVALREIRGYIEEQGVEVQGPPFSICHPVPDHRIDVEAGWPVRGASGAGRIACREMPPGLIRRRGDDASRSISASSRELEVQASQRVQVDPATTS